MNAPSLKRVDEEERVNNEVVKVREILDIDPIANFCFTLELLRLIGDWKI